MCSVAFNSMTPSSLEDMLCYSGNGKLYVRTGSFPVQEQARQTIRHRAIMAVPRRPPISFPLPFSLQTVADLLAHFRLGRPRPTESIARSSKHMCCMRLDRFEGSRCNSQQQTKWPVILPCPFLRSLLPTSGGGSREKKKKRADDGR